MIFPLLASISKIFAFASSLVFQFSIISIAASLAPPCRGPFKEPIAATTQENISDIVDAQTLAVKVDALNSCSAYKTKEASMTRL